MFIYELKGDCMNRIYVPSNVNTLIDFAVSQFFAEPTLRSKKYQRRASFLEVDITDDGEAYVIEADLPGVLQEQITIEVEGKRVTLNVSENAQEQKSEKKYLHRERSNKQSSSTRTLTLPETLDPDSAKASLINGVLSLKIAKKFLAEKRVISISQ